MKLLLTILFVALCLHSGATNYYFSTSTGNDSRTSTQAQSSSTPWQTLTKFNSFFPSLSPGDSVLFKAGEKFDGGMVISRSGSIGLPIVISSYGVGAKPVINGFVTLSSWTSLGGNIYEAAVNSGLRLNMVTIDGKMSAPGRYPNYNTINGGYLTVNAAAPQGLSSAVDYVGVSSYIVKTGLVGSWAGAEVAVVKNSYTYDRFPVISQSGDTTRYIGVSGNQQEVGFGFFFQNALATLDSVNEWYYNAIAHTIRIYGDPSAKVVKASTTETLIDINNKSYIDFIGLRMEGSDTATVAITNGSHHIYFTECDLVYNGTEALTTMNQTTNCNNISFIDGSIDKTASAAVLMYNTNNLTFVNNRVTFNGLILGLGRDGQNGYMGIYVKGDNNLFAYNFIDSSGTSALGFMGNYVIVRRNYVNMSTMIMSDQGGIYTFAPGFVGRKIIGNIVMNSQGAVFGTPFLTPHAGNGIYLDEGADNVVVDSNTVIGCNSNAFYLHVAPYNTITNNIAYGNKGAQLSLNDDQPNSPRIRGVHIARNIFIATDKTQGVVKLTSKQNDIGLFATFDSNYYARPHSPGGMFETTFRGGCLGCSSTEYTWNYDLSGWQAAFSADAHSSSGLTLSEYTTISAGTEKISGGDFASNVNTAEADAQVTKLWDTKLDGHAVKITANSPTDSAYRGFVVQAGSAAAGTVYRIKFSVIGSVGTRTGIAYVRRWGTPNYNIVSIQKAFPITTTRSEVEFLYVSDTIESEVKLTIISPAIDMPFWVDNISMKQVSLNYIPLSDSLRLVLNASNLQRNINLPAVYKTINNNSFSAISLPAFSAVLLQRLAALPPVKSTQVKGRGRPVTQ